MTGYKTSSIFNLCKESIFVLLPVKCIEAAAHYLFKNIQTRINIFPFFCSPLYYTPHFTFKTVEPKVYVSAGSTPLLEGRNESLVAICIAERGRPEAEVSWESDLSGQSVTQTHDDANGTTSVQVSYMWRPQSYAQGKTLTCVVRHPALQTEFKIPYTLNVQCKSIKNSELCL